jgi:tRNA(Ile)-lysidine synthase
VERNILRLILAVSGGIDSVVMLHSLAAADGFAEADSSELIVAHFEHGIRDDSMADARFVAELAGNYGLKFELGIANLGKDVNEADARTARWNFLKDLQKQHDAAVATGHHLDDILETQIINLLRGSGRRGLSVLKQTDLFKRPLINRTKQNIYEYAAENNLEFVEDSTNHSMKYLRNRVRNSHIPRLNRNQQLHELLSSVDAINKQIDLDLSVAYERLVSQQSDRLIFDRSKIRYLDEKVLGEVLRKSLDSLGVVHKKQKIQKHTIDLLVEFAQRNDSNKLHDISKNIKAKLTKTHLELFISD